MANSGALEVPRRGRKGGIWITSVSEVDPFDEPSIRRHLEANGVEAGVTGSRYGAEGEGPSIYVIDPEGNVVELKGPPGN